MSRLSETLIRSRHRAAVLVLFSTVAAIALGARCIENTYVYVDRDGYTHILGEFFNDTDVQASGVILRGTLLDAQGNTIAVKDAPICPPDSQPGSQATFDIRFDSPNLPPHASFAVNTIKGTTMDGALPSPNILVLQTRALKLINVPAIPGFPYRDGDVLFSFGVRNRSNTVYTGVQACAAAYNNAGQVIDVESGEVVSIDADGNIGPAVLDFRNRVDFFIGMQDVPPQAAYVRGWLWIGNTGDTTSQYQFIMTPPITLQTFDFFN